VVDLRECCKPVADDVPSARGGPMQGRGVVRGFTREGLRTAGRMRAPERPRWHPLSIRGFAFHGDVT
jgi:hypothetical protein